MSHFRKITVDSIEYEYRLNSLTFFVRNKELKIRHSVTTEKLDSELNYCPDCGINCYKNRPTAVLPSTVAAYIKDQDFHKPLQSKTSPELVRIRPKKKKLGEMSIQELIQEILDREQREKTLEEKRRLQKKNKTQPKKKASSNGAEWRKAARENAEKERREIEEKRRLSRHREHWANQ